jgi:hypothetical protein
MPQSRRSLAITDAYRERLLATRQRLERLTAQRWPTIRDDFQVWVDSMAPATAQAQREAVRATQGYLAAFLTSELGRRQRPPQIAADNYTGRARDGRPLSESLASPLIGVKAALKDGEDPSRALADGLVKAQRMVGVDFDNAHRTALLEAIDTDERFDGWQRALRGTCGACAAVAVGVGRGLSFEVHPGCQCVSEPVVAGVSNAFPRPTGLEIFAAKSEDEQNEMLGPEAASRVRSGEMALADLAGHSHLETQDDFLTQAPIGA